MAQYTELGDMEVLSRTDGVDTFRLRSADNKLYIEQLTGEATWSAVETHELTGGAGSTTLRVGARSGHWVIDQVYDGSPLEFSGSEGFDWDNESKYQL